jgi:GNAT superfamily N-acetyltransferase
VTQPVREVVSRLKVMFQKADLPGDRSALVAFDRKVFPKADWFSPESWNALESYWMIVDGKRVGCCAFERDADFENNPEDASPRRRGSLYVASTGILPDYQRRGFGERFKRWQIAWARRHDFTRIVTNSRQSNRHMIHVNEKCGFSILRTTGWNYYQCPAEPAVVMELKLPPPTSRLSQGVILSQPMQNEQIVALLIAERDRLSRAIDALQGPAKRIGRPPVLAKRRVRAAAPSRPAPVARKRTMSAAGRKAIAEAAKRRWAAIKAAKAK